MRIPTMLGRITALLVLLTSAGAVAGEWKTYEPSAFAEAQDAGRTIFVAVHADWCPTCRAQRPILESLIDEAIFEDSVAFSVDYDKQKDFLREHRVRYQATLIVFKGLAEVDRSLADLNQTSIRELFAVGL